MWTTFGLGSLSTPASPPADTGASSSAEGMGPTIVKTPGLQTVVLCQTEAQAMQNMSPTCFSETYVLLPGALIQT